MALNPDYVRVCPVCATAAAADATQCAQCGTLLLGVDLTLPPAAPAAVPVAPAPSPAAAPSAAPVCAHADCGQPNPPGSANCLYCGRPLVAESVPPASTSAIAPGALYKLPGALADKFTIVEVLPAGGAEAEIMVLAGRGSGVKVIAKLYRPGMLPKSEVLERVSRAAFRHVVRLIAHGESDGIGYEVMEYCPQGSLRDLMRTGEQPRDRLRQIVAELAAALDALHELNVIHRDLKPENVLVRRLDPLDLVLTDFGIASLTDATQVFTSLARSVKYGAPETLAGVLDQAADWWSLGMIVVELLTGHHPFDGLSDAVITHRLVTAAIDLDAVADTEWRKLCRGLLLRDPGQRWGAAEVARWLAGDATLDMPAAEAPGAPLPGVRPYRLGDQACSNAAELAVALATHWEAGRKDLMRGQLSAWVGQELQDDNLLRFIHDQLDLRDVSDDLRLLRVIRHLAPELPPVWRGASLALPGLLAQAAKAEQGDRAAADWLISVAAQQALRELAPAHCPAEAALVPRWEAARARFATLWHDSERDLLHWRKTLTSRDGIADFDAIVFGQPDALALPAPEKLQPPLLLALADEAYATALQERLRNEAAPWLESNPWLAALAAQHDPVATLVGLFLLPHARATAEDVQRRAERTQIAEAAQQVTLSSRANLALALTRERCTLGAFANTHERDAAANAVQETLTLLEEARQAGLPDSAPLMRALHRAEPILLRIQERLDAWEHAARINAAWRNQNLMRGGLGFAFFMFFIVAENFPRLLAWLLAVPALLIAWRVMGLMGLRGDLRKLVQALPSRVPSALP